MFPHMKKLDLLLLLLAILFSAGSTLGQDRPKSDTEGLFLNFHLNGTSWDLSDDSEFGELPRESGGGLMVFLVPAFAITADAQATWGSMTEITTGGVSLNTSIGAQSTRLNAGLTWFPGR